MIKVRGTIIVLVKRNILAVELQRIIIDKNTIGSMKVKQR